MSVRLVLAIISTLLEEAAIAVIVLLALPRVGIQMPLAGLITLMVVWGTFSVFLYQMGSRALRRKPVISLPDMVHAKGKVASPLDPEGLVRIKGELWIATSASGRMNTGEEIFVVEQEGLKLIVNKSSDLKANE